MATRYFVPTCMYCGKTGSRRPQSNGCRPSTAPPSMAGKCPSSPDGKHKPKWEED